jgi:hypothetical protein
MESAMPNRDALNSSNISEPGNCKAESDRIIYNADQLIQGHPHHIQLMIIL